LVGNEIVVRIEASESTFTTLDGQQRMVPAGTLYIRDGEKPVALAGVMGGLNSEIADTTTDILIESAYFDPKTIRRASKLLGLQTDSSYRFERGIDPAITRRAALRCAKLILGMCPGAGIVGGIDAHPVKTEPKTVDLRLEFVNRILGMDLKLNQVVSVLRGLEFDVHKLGDSRLSVTVPTFRPDISREIDLVEEVARILDYNKIPNPGKIQFSRPYPLPFRETAIRRIREAAVRLGFREMYGNSLLPEQFAGRFADETTLIHTLNPISRDTTTLRPVLAPGFLRAAAFNANRGAKRVRLFEIGNIFRQDATGTWPVQFVNHGYTGVFRWSDIKLVATRPNNLLNPQQPQPRNNNDWFNDLFSTGRN
jgi:phenylalanyl-tRNA synthetase beta chain